MMAPHIRNGLIFIGLSIAAGGAMFIAFSVSQETDTEVDEIDQEQTFVPSTAEAAENSCLDGQIELWASSTESADGVVELMTSRDNTDAVNLTTIAINNGLGCISRARLAKLARDTGNGQGPLNIVVTYDPTGTTEEYRSILTFFPDPGDPDPAPSQPPKDLQFGRASWSGSSRSTQLGIDWSTFGDVAFAGDSSATGAAGSHPIFENRVGYYVNVQGGYVCEGEAWTNTNDGQVLWSSGDSDEQVIYSYFYDGETLMLFDGVKTGKPWESNSTPAPDLELPLQELGGGSWLLNGEALTECR